MSLLCHEASAHGWPPTKHGAPQAGLRAPPPVRGARHGTMHTVCLRPASCVVAAAADCWHTTCCSLGMRPRPGLSAWCTIAAGRTAAASSHRKALLRCRNRIRAASLVPDTTFCRTCVRTGTCGISHPRPWETRLALHKLTHAANKHTAALAGPKVSTTPSCAVQTGKAPRARPSWSARGCGACKACAPCGAHCARSHQHNGRRSAHCVGCSTRMSVCAPELAIFGRGSPAPSCTVPGLQHAPLLPSPHPLQTASTMVTSRQTSMGTPASRAGRRMWAHNTARPPATCTRLTVGGTRLGGKPGI
jgi:hypothetical protein